MKKETLNEKKKVPADLFDSTVNITPSKIRYFTIGVLILLTVLLVWGIFGRIMVKMKASGIITNILSIYTVSSDNEGVVYEIYKKRGETVKKGEKLLKLSQVELNLQLNSQVFLLSQQIVVDSFQILTLNKKKKLKLSLIRLQKEELISSMEQTTFEIEFYQNMINDSELLLQKGVISNTEYNQTLFQLQKLHLLLKSDSVQLVSVEHNREIFIQQMELEKQQINASLLELQEQTNSLHTKYDTFSYINSNSDGIIQECLVKNGIPVAKYQDVFTIRQINKADTNLYVDLFIPFSDLEKAELYMKTVVSPFNVDENVYGKIEATITEISDYPATKEYILYLLGDIGVVDAFGAQGPFYYSKAILTTDSSTISGLKWTSAKGPPFKVNAGMICKADIIVESRAPISFVIPWFRKGLKDE